MSNDPLTYRRAKSAKGFWDGDMFGELREPRGFVITVIPTKGHTIQIRHGWPAATFLEIFDAVTIGVSTVRGAVGWIERNNLGEWVRPRLGPTNDRYDPAGARKIAASLNYTADVLDVLWKNLPEKNKVLSTEELYNLVWNTLLEGL